GVDGDPRSRLSFPTRRSSDLLEVEGGVVPDVFADAEDGAVGAGLAETDWLGVVAGEGHVPDAFGEGVGRLGWSGRLRLRAGGGGDRKSTRLNSSHLGISYAVF